MNIIITFINKASTLSIFRFISSSIYLQVVRYFRRPIKRLVPYIDKLKTGVLNSLEHYTMRPNLGKLSMMFHCDN